MSNAKTTPAKRAARKTASTARKSEAAGAETVEVTWLPMRLRDIEDAPAELRLIVPARPDDWPVEVTEAFEDGKAATALRSLFGPDQWSEFKALRPTNADMDDLFNHMARIMGFTKAGESSASSD